MNIAPMSHLAFAAALIHEYRGDNGVRLDLSRQLPVNDPNERLYSYAFASPHDRYLPAATRIETTDGASGTARAINRGELFRAADRIAPATAGDGVVTLQELTALLLREDSTPYDGAFDARNAAELLTRYPETTIATGTFRMNW